MTALRHCCVMLALAVLACQLGPEDHVGRVALGLTGQFLPGELTTIDIEVFRADRVTCADQRRVEGDTSGGRVGGETGLTLPADDVQFTLDPGSYVVGVVAGQAGDLGPGGTPVAEGCATVQLTGGGTADVTVPLRRQDRCGDGNLDLIETCDDGNEDRGDGCDTNCRTEAGWLSTHPDDTEGNQSAPIADGDLNLASVCWRSDAPSNDEAPTLWLDRTAEPVWDEVFYQATDPPQQCTAMDVVAGSVLMTFLRGEDLSRRFPIVQMWNASGTPLETMQVGLFGDRSMVGSFLDPLRSVIVVGRPSGGTDATLELHAQLITVSGSTIELEGSESPVDDSGTTTGQTVPAVAGGGDGQYIVAWRGSLGRIWARVFDSPDSGGALLRLYDGSGVCGPPSVARARGAGEDRYAVVFSDGEFGRISARLISSASAMSDLIEIAGVDRSIDPVVSAHDEEFIVSWAQPGPDGTDVYARVLVGDDDGDPVFGHLAAGDRVTSEPLMVNPTTSGAQDNPSIAPGTGLDEGTAIVVYRDSTGDGDDIAARVIRVARPPSE